MALGFCLWTLFQALKRVENTKRGGSQTGAFLSDIFSQSKLKLYNEKRETQNHKKDANKDQISKLDELLMILRKCCDRPFVPLPVLHGTVCWRILRSLSFQIALYSVQLQQNHTASGTVSNKVMKAARD